MATSVSTKAGNSAGVKKGWLHRHRPGALQGKTGTERLLNLSSRSGKVLSGLYLKKFGKRMKRGSLKHILKGNFGRGVIHNAIGNKLVDAGDVRVRQGWYGKEKMSNTKLKGFAAMIAKKKAKMVTQKAKKPKLGSGGRFQALTAKLSGKVSDPKAVAAAIGRKKYGAGRMSKLAAHGKELSLEQQASLIQSGLNDLVKAACPPPAGQDYNSCWISDTFDNYIILYDNGHNYMAEWGTNQDGTYWLQDKADWEEVVRAWQVVESTDTGQKELQVTYKVGNAAGVKKGWLHRRRGKVGGAISNVINRFARGSGKPKASLGQIGHDIKKAITPKHKKPSLKNIGSDIKKAVTPKHKKYKEQEGLVFSFKDENDKDCFLLVAGGSYEDGDKQWITKDAYANWIATLKENDNGFLERENGEEVVYRLWHIGEPDKETGSRGPGADIGKFRYIEQFDNFIVALGEYDTKEIADVIAPISDDLGASLGYFHPASQPKETGGEFREIDGFEISALPKHRASFPFTITLN